MKLKKFTPETTPTLRAGSEIPTLHMNYSSGVLTLNRGACEKLNIQPGDQVVLHQDEDEPQDWYLQVVKSGGFALRCKTGESYPLAFNNATLIRQVIDSVAYDVPEGVETETPKSVKVRIMDATEIEGEKFYCIIMTSADAKF